MSRNALGACFILISILLIFIDSIAGRTISFTLFYFFIIWLTVVYAGAPYSYLIALITASGRSYAAFTGHTLSDPILVGGWLLITHLTVYTLYCYLLAIYYQIHHFLKPHNNQLLAAELHQYPFIREFIFRPYVNRYWNLKTRLGKIACHYQLVKSHVSFLNVASGRSLELTRFCAGDDILRVIIDRPKWMRPEGEIAISLFYGIDRIYTAMFLLSGTAEHMQLIVGNVQGDGRNRLELYRQITKTMHGIRPRDLLLDILIMLGAAVGCREILGISDEAHRSAYWLSQAKKLSTYDEIWLEHGGVKDVGSGFFHLSSRIEKRPNEEIPARKRALYRRRYQFLDDLQLKIRMRVSQSDSHTLLQ